MCWNFCEVSGIFETFLATQLRNAQFIKAANQYRNNRKEFSIDNDGKNLLIPPRNWTNKHYLLEIADSC